ncbi:hypothetical protein [Paenibacillus agricola]|uniref:hypothetical protein n=1 Tax=Paenibacillus agricola TaxID=2716264 RepID=UPI001A9D9ED8|nr:hypothetical protein [Paenibacillus agricola]
MTMLGLLLPSVASAHVVNEQTIYEDIQFSAAKEPIVSLSAIGVIPYEHGASLFKPNDPLSRKDLAYWAGSFQQLPAASPTASDIAKAAENAGLVSSLQGNATYREVSQAFFGGQAKVATGQLDSELTREAFVLFMTANLDQQVGGNAAGHTNGTNNTHDKTLYEMAGFTPGPAGKIEEISQQETKDAEGKVTKTYILQIGGKDWSLSDHPKIANAAVDPALWKNKELVRSWTQKVGSNEGVMQLLIFDKQAAGLDLGAGVGSKETSTNSSVSSAHGGHGGGTGATAGGGHGSGTGGTTASGHGSMAESGHINTNGGTPEAVAKFPFVPLILLTALALIGGWLFAKRKRKMI